jgi:hypothetical protein
VTVYALGANGNVAPVRTMSGSNTGLNSRAGNALRSNVSKPLAQHINQIVCGRNPAPGSAGVVLCFSDIALPLLMRVLAFASRGA